MQQYFKYLNNYYDKIYVLSVQAAVARRQQFATLFAGLQYEFFFGADKNKFTIEEMKQKGTYSEPLTKKNHRYSKAMKHGELACSISHKMMYEDMLAKNYEQILIFEDDVVPDEMMVKQIPEIIQQIPGDCELLMWGWGKNGTTPAIAPLKKALYHLQHSTGLLKWSHKVISNIYATPFSKNIKKAGFHDYTYAYAINRAGAKKLLQMQTPLQYIADNLLAYAATTGVVTGYITFPMIFLHDSLPDGTPKDSYIR
jgi:glycosyl transferase, family 25